ncbi:YggT family protein [Paucisalibacillus sp. EB02]|uniref:YggT family protein n=1 Tax=Paucisalibacillus sp. EB02 TaxID=1347087 RepID=UPI0004B64417|nr:YggT family protein [Paucisalibacillus sp. EB02]
MLYIIFDILARALEIYSIGLIIYIFMSWFPGARESTFGSIMTKLYEPFLEPFRKIIPPLGMIDISPIVAIIVLRLAGAGIWGLYNMIVRFIAG